MAGEIDDIEAGILAILRGLPQKIRNPLQQSIQRLQVHQLAFLDPTGPPPGVLSSSPRIAIRGGNTAAALAPGGEGNVTAFLFTGDELALMTGIEDEILPYPRLHEFGSDVYNVPFPARPFYYPGYEKWLEAEGNVIDLSISTTIADQWNRG